MMGLLTLLLTILLVFAICAAIMWFVRWLLSQIVMDPTLRNILLAATALLLLIGVLHYFHLLDRFG